MRLWLGTSYALAVTRFLRKRSLLGVLAMMFVCTVTFVRLSGDLARPTAYIDKAYSIAEVRGSSAERSMHSNDVPQQHIASLDSQKEHDILRPMQAPPTNDSAYHSRINVSTSWVLSNRNTTDMDSGMSSESRKCFHFSSVKYGDLCVESILGDEQFRLVDKLHSHATMSKAPKMILSFVRHITQSNLGGCPDWNCKILNTKALSREKVDAFVTGPMPIYKIRLSPQQYVVCHSQEANFCTIFLSQNRANMTMTYRRNSPISSPYGYTVKLAPVSQRNDGKQPINEKRIRKKSKAIAWFVSNCFAASGREEVISELKKYIDVDIYGRCGKMYCTKGGQCEQMLNTE
ncbi:Alpha-(1,3)-fucosyltransferase C [Toxocara canis]|uniref:Fucosyltransferase n=1 Tax=Toxocara canis TaxID=6265 RepID=A0A0B2VB36_TOXCA|nr:Alpha-(1,3)-fucosyltransferase C [Toxocara canis]